MASSVCVFAPAGVFVHSRERILFGWHSATLMRVWGSRPWPKRLFQFGTPTGFNRSWQIGPINIGRVEGDHYQRTADSRSENGAEENRRIGQSAVYRNDQGRGVVALWRAEDAHCHR